jgi:hypothetical protein
MENNCSTRSSVIKLEMAFVSVLTELSAIGSLSADHRADLLSKEDGLEDEQTHTRDTESRTTEIASFLQVS